MKHPIFTFALLIVAANCSALSLAPYYHTLGYDDRLTSTDYDISITEPYGFRLADTTRFIQNMNLPHGTLMFTLRDSVDNDPELFLVSAHESRIFISPDNDCMLIHPLLDFTYIGSARAFAEYELGALLETDPSTYIRTIPDDSIAIYCNADKGFIYDAPLIKPKFKFFTHIVGIMLDKYGHPTVSLKILLTKDGLKNKDKYIKTMIESIKYGNTPSEIGIQIFKEKTEQWQEQYKRWKERNDSVESREITDYFIR